MSMQSEPMTREDLLSDAVLVTSDSPAKTVKAIKAQSSKAKIEEPPVGDSDDDDTDKSALGDDDDATAESGDDSDSSKEADAGEDDDEDDDESTSDDDDPDSDDDDAETDDDNEDGTDGISDTKPGKGKKQKSGISKRFSHLSSQVSELSRKLAESERLRAEERAAKPQTPAEKKIEAKLDDATSKVEEFSTKPAPTEDDVDAKGKPMYETYGDYVKALAKWTDTALKDANTQGEKRAAKMVADAIKELETKFEAKAQNNAIQTELKRMTDLYESRKSTLRKSNPEVFDKYVTDNKNRPELGQSLSSLVILHEQGPDVLLHLCKNPKTAAKLNSMAPDDQKVQFGVILASLSKAASKPTQNGSGKKTIRPNEPIPRGGKAGGKGSAGKMTYRRAENMSADDYIAARANGSIK